jgi:cation diffusion facilitator CzcD-associated flavoprotein CzcO
MNDKCATYTVHPADRQVPDEVEVAVIGAGPSGLTAATMLAAYGIRAVVLDRAAGPAG